MRAAVIAVRDAAGNVSTLELPQRDDARQPDEGDAVPSEGAGGRSVQYVVEPGDPYQAMIEAFASAVRGSTEWPRPVERSIELLKLIERIRDATHD